MIFNMSSGGGSNAGLNFKVVGGNEAPVSPSENTIWVNTNTPITKWAMASKNPYAYEVEVDYLNGKATTAGYFSSTGAITAQNSTKKEVYVEAYIPVKYGHNYTYNYTIASSKAMWLCIVEYTRDHTFAKRIVPVNDVTGTVQTGKYAPSSSNVVEVRLSWRTFGLDTTVEFKGTEETADTSTNGAVWIHTAVNSDARFNALKKNDLQVYPVRAKQCVNGSWKELEGHSYQNGAWKQWVPYGALYWYGDLCEEVSGGEWTPKNLKTNSEVGNEFDLPTITYNFDHLLIDWRIAGWGGGAAKMLNSQDLTDVSLLQLEFEGEVLQNDADLFLSVYTKESNYHSDSVASIRIIDHAKGSPQLVGRRTVTLDVSALSGAHYIRFFGWDSWSGSNSVIILKVYALRKIYSE